MSDTDSNQEGICSAGPIFGQCSLTAIQGCNDDGDCSQANCPFCQSGETCITKNRPCWVNSGITRTGSPRTPNGESVGIYCVPSNGAAINTTAGFPGPGALTQRETVQVVP
jgi:hypothetical protein